MLEHLRRTVSRLLEASPGGGQRPAELRRTLDLDAALAWQVHTLATVGDALRAGRVVPKAGAMERFFRAARSTGVADALAREAEEAYAQFERLVGDHAGNRETFDAMVAALRPEDTKALERLRRAAFKANSAVWGVSIRCSMHCVVFNERPTGEHDCLSVRARIGVQCLRGGAKVGIYASARTWGGSYSPPEGAPNVALDECQLLPEYCSSPMPHIERAAAADGTYRDYLCLDGVGRTSEVTLVWRNLSPAFPGGSRTPPHGCSAQCLEPTEMQIVDLLIPRGWTDPQTARVLVTPVTTPIMVPLAGGVQQLAFEGRVEHLGSRIEGMFARQAPRFTEVLAAELAKLGWDPEGFDIYRCIVKYPVLHAAVHVALDGPAGSGI